MMQAGEVLRTDRGDAWKIYHVNLLEEWREAVPVALVTVVVQRETGREGGGDLGPHCSKTSNAT